MRRLYVGPPGTTVAGSDESHQYHGHDWRAGGLAGRRYKCNVKFNWRGTGLGARVGIRNITGMTYSYPWAPALHDYEGPRRASPLWATS